MLLFPLVLLMPVGKPYRFFYLLISPAAGVLRTEGCSQIHVPKSRILGLIAAVMAAATDPSPSIRKEKKKNE